jgi:hypothetical protein
MGRKSHTWAPLSIVYLDFGEFFAVETEGKPVLTNLLLEGRSNMGVRGVCSQGEDCSEQ